MSGLRERLAALADELERWRKHPFTSPGARRFALEETLRAALAEDATPVVTYACCGAPVGDVVRMDHRCESATPDDVEAQAKVLRDAADAWMHGEWANHMVTASDPAQIRIGSANRFGEWLRDRADRIGGDA